MNFYSRQTVLFTLIFSCAVYTVQAQLINKNNFEIGFSAGTAIYQGDIAPAALGSYKRLQPAYSLYTGKWIDKYFLLQGNFTHSSITAFDADWSQPAYKRLRNLNFYTSINEVNVRLLFSPLGNYSYTPDKRWYPYVFAGAGVAFTQVNRNWSGIDSSFLSAKVSGNLAADSAHKLPVAIPSLPFGAGVRYALSPHISLFAEITYHLPVTDFLDGFSYIANPHRKDNYYNYSAGINYTFLKNGNRCPHVKK